MRSVVEEWSVGSFVMVDFWVFGPVGVDSFLDLVSKVLD